MNYRRGLQRVYVVLTAIWMACVLFTVLTGRWEPWRKATTDFTPPPPDSWQGPAPVISPEEFLKKKTARLEDVDEAATRQLMMRQRFGCAFAIAIAPPLFAYLALFFVVPWVYRGFRSNAV